MNTMMSIIETLEEFCPGVNFDECTTLVDDLILDSLTMIAVVAELEDSFEITIPPVEITAANFNSAATICALVERLAEDNRD